MRLTFPLVCVLLLTACGARSINNSNARDAIIEIPQSALQKEDVEVVKVSRVTGTEAIAETRLKTAFRLEKVKDDWIVREVRLGHGEWQKVENLAAAMEAVKTAETKAMLERIAEAIQKFRESTGSLPAFKDYIALSDQLSPKFLTPLIRLDSWRQPLGAQRQGADTIVLLSAGPDGKFNTPDDIRRTITPR